MLDIKVLEESKTVEVDISGYITTKEASEFLNKHKQYTKAIRNSQYRLVANVSIFECESEKDIENVCITFYKSGYKKIYLIDPNNHILKTMGLSPIEKKMFTKFVKLVKTKEQIK